MDKEITYKQKNTTSTSAAAKNSNCSDSVTSRLDDLKISNSCNTNGNSVVSANGTNNFNNNNNCNKKKELSANTRMIHEHCQDLLLSDGQMDELCIRILHEIKRGLRKETHAAADVKCFVTYVQDLPNGNERGKFLALDLGGTNFRVLLIHLKEANVFHMQSRIYAIPQHIMLGPGLQLFDHIAECLSNFMKEHNVYTERLPLGFTFSFPLTQLGLTKGEFFFFTYSCYTFYLFAA